MCQYTVFNFLCGAQKLKIATPCDKAKTNYQGILYCQDDPHAHVHDDKPRNYAPETYGPGICANVNCRTAHGMAPPEQIGLNTWDLEEDDLEFDMSPRACAEREDRWHRSLTTHQQFETIGAQMPPPIAAVSSYAKWWLYIEHMPPDWAATWDQLTLVDNPDEMSFLELNPRHLTQRALHHVTGHFLPANITDTRHSSHKIHATTTTPRMPALGPFKTKSHTCKPNVGHCRTCGDWHGKEYARKPHKFVEATFDDFLEALANDRATNLLGVGVNMPHVRPTLNMPTPFHGNDYNRKIKLVNTGKLSPEENRRMISTFMVKVFGSEDQVGQAGDLNSGGGDHDHEMSAGFDGVSSSGEMSALPGAQFQDFAIAPTATAEHAMLNSVRADDDFDDVGLDFGGVDGVDGVDGDDAMMIDI